MRRGGTDPWAVDFDKELAGKDIQDASENMKDSAKESIGDRIKSFSF